MSRRSAARAEASHDTRRALPGSRVRCLGRVSVVDRADREQVPSGWWTRMSRMRIGGTAARHEPRRNPDRGGRTSIA